MVVLGVELVGEAISLGSIRYKARYFGPVQAGERWADGVGKGLGQDLVFGGGCLGVQGHFAHHFAHGIGIRFRTVVVVHPIRTEMPVVAVEGLHRRTVGFFAAVQGVAVESEADGQHGSSFSFEMKRGGVVVVIVCPATVAAKFV